MFYIENRWKWKASSEPSRLDS